ncbi:type I restriction endonuclease [Aeromonas caviae]|uniref:type I restriction endonuclease n=1 Tax=Aeromonas caviae TaxID=648 RepID=UPI0038D17D60
MGKVGQKELATQQRVLTFFQQRLGWHYLGNWHTRPNNRNVEPALLTSWLAGRGVDGALIPRVLRQLERAASLGEGRQLYDANKEVYRLLRYGVKEKSGAGEQHQTVWLVDWANPEANDFAIAEEVTVAGENTKRPDLVLYVNGIALGKVRISHMAREHLLVTH